MLIADGKARGKQVSSSCAGSEISDSTQEGLSQTHKQVLYIWGE